MGFSGASCAASDTSPSIPTSVQVVAYDVQGNSLLANGLMQAALQPYQGAQTLDGLNAALAAVQSLYRQAGYGAVVVNLPVQNLSNGTVRMDVVEGKLGQVLVQGNNHFTTDNILKSLPSLKVGATPQLFNLDTHTLMANENPAKTVRVFFQPGLRTGQVDALVTTEEQKPAQWVLGADNTGRTSSGEYRTSLAYQHANVFQRDHVLALRLDTSLTQPANSLVGGLSYRVPLYGQYTAVELVASYSTVKNRATPTAAGDLTFAGQGQSVGLRYHWYLPKLGESKQKISLGWDWREYRNDCSIGTLGAQGCGSAASSVEVRPITLTYQAYTLGRYNANVQLSSNLWSGGALGQASNFEASRPGAKPNYTVLRGGLQTNHRLNEQFALLWRTSAQLTTDALISAEQFGLGGASTVRGYQERELVGDQGITTSLELSMPLTTSAAPLLKSWGLADVAALQLQGTLFVDAGQVNNRLGTACASAQSSKASCHMAGLGLGVTLSQNKRWSLKADLARAMNTSSATQRGDYRLHVAYSLAF